jgi:hypothetical protein
MHEPADLIAPACDDAHKIARGTCDELPGIHSLGGCGVHNWMFMLALLLVSSARSGHAQPSQAVVQYHAPANCPNQVFFNERMRARLNADGVRARPGARLTVQVELAAAGARGSVRIQQQGSSAQRSLEAGSCKEVVEGLALIAALAIATPPGRPVAREDSTRARSDARAPSAAHSPDAPSINSVTQSDRSPAATAAAAPAAVDSRATADAGARSVSSEAVTAGQASAPPAAQAESETAGAQDHQPAIDSPPESAETSDDPRLRGVLIDAGFIVIHGPAPDMRPGVQLGAAVVLATGALDWRLLFAGRLALPETSSSAQGTTRFGFVAGVVELCVAAALGGRWSWDGCAVVEPGMWTASGENTGNAREYRRGWLALGAGTGFSLRLLDWLGIRAGGELLAPTRRDRALLADQVVHHVPPVSLRLELGLEARPW